MAIGIDELDDDDDVLIEPQLTEEPPVQLQEVPSSNGEDYISDFLKTRGIDPENVNFEDENGQISTRNWNDLSKEEKINILNMPLEQEDNNEPQITEDEINLINQFRQSNLSLEDYLNSLKGEQQVVEPLYKIDDLSDDEVYLLDLESRVGELSEEEAAQALNFAKLQNEDLFKKQIEGIRKEYKEREDFQNQQELAQLEQLQQEAFRDYSEKVINAIDGFNSIGNLDLSFSDSDKEELADFMLSLDETGKNYLYEALQDPETLTRAAWFILNGEDAFNSVTEYFTSLIKQVSEAQYKKGLEDGKKGISLKPQVYIDNNKKTNNVNRSYNSIDDLDDDE